MWSKEHGYWTNWGLIQKCNFWWGSNPQLLVRVTKNSIGPTATFSKALASLESASQRRLVRGKVWAPSKIVIFDGAQTKQCWPEAERTLSSLMFWWGILRKSSIRTTSNLPLQVVKHLNQRRWWLYKVWAPSKIIIFDGAQAKQCWPESERTLSSLMFWWGILRKSPVRTTCNLPLQVAKHRNQRRWWWVDKVWVSWDRMPVQISFFTTLFLLLSSCGMFRLASTGQHINPANWSKLGRACNVMLWWTIGRESCIRTTCNLRLWVVKHLNQRRLESYRGTALAGFEPVTICFRDCFKMPRELRGGFKWKITVLDSDLPLPFLKQE